MFSSFQSFPYCDRDRADSLVPSDLPLFEDELKVEIVNNTILIRQGKGKKFIFMSSILCSIELAASMPGLNDAYCVSRAALNMLIRKWGGAWKFEGISTALIHPGMSSPTLRS